MEPNAIVPRLNQAMSSDLIQRGASILALVLTGVGCTSADDSPGASRSRPTVVNTSESLPPTPAKSRWVGLDGVMVAIPKSFRRAPDPCDRDPVGMFVVQRSYWPNRRCFANDERGDGPRIAVIRTADLNAFGDFGRERTLRDLDVRETRHICSASVPSTCSVAVAVPDQGVVISIVYRHPPTGRPLIEKLLDSLRPIPHGYVAVPPLNLYGSVEQAKEQLDDVGLVGMSPDVNFPHYLVGVTPVIGSIVPSGANIKLAIGDG